MSRELVSGVIPGDLAWTAAVPVAFPTKVLEITGRAIKQHRRVKRRACNGER